MPRQMYGLGSLVKSIGKGVKKAVGGVKDLIKSDFGKAVGLAALGSYGLGMGPLGGLPKAGFLKNIPGLLKTGIDTLGLGVPTGEKPNFGQFAKVFGLGALGGVALEALQASGAEEGDITDIDALRSYLRQGYKQLNPEASEADVEAFIEQNTVEYRANGGRIGYSEGTEPEYGTEEYYKKNLDVLDLDELIEKPFLLNTFTIGLIEERINQYGKAGGDITPYLDKYKIAKQKNAEYFESLSEEEQQDYTRRNREMLEKDLNMGIFPNQENLGILSLEKETDSGDKIPAPKKDVFDIEGFKQYRMDVATGGRIGYAEGMNDPKTLPKGLTMDTTTKNPIPENALPKEIEMISKIMIGPGSAGIGEPEDGTMKGYQFFKNQYLPKKVKELSENFGYSEDEIYKMINTRVREYIGNPGKPKMAMGGRIKYANGSDDYEKEFMKLVGEFMEQGFSQQEAIDAARDEMERKSMKYMAEGGRIKYAMGDSAEQNAVQASGIMGLPLNQNPAGITELDLRETGGFIPPVGVKEKADDIPAMLSNNEFVFTADAVRGMGGGNVEKGAQRLYDQMKMLEEGGKVA